MEFKKYKLNEVLTLNPTLKLKKNAIAKKIAMENIKEYQKKIDSYTYSEFKSGSKFMNGDTLLARITPCLENGKTAYVDILDEDEIAFGSTEFFVLRPKDNLMDSHFLYYLMRTNELRNTIIKSMTGTSGRQRAQKESILEYEFCLPSLKIQTAIAKLLKNLDDKIETNKKIIANLQELSQTLFKRWFVDFEFPDENGNPYKSNGGEMVDSELGRKPVNWDVVKLGSIANIRTGYAFKSTEYVEQRQLPVLRTLNISKSNLLVTMNDIKFVPYQYLYMDKYQKYNLELFDTLLVTVGGSIGNLGLVTENNIPSLQNQNMWRFKSIKSNIGNTFVYQLILYVNSLVRNQTSGSAREFYTKKTFENFNLVLPKLDSYLYESINKYLENFGKKISDLNVEIEKLTQLRDTLLPKLISGEIEIPDDIEVNEDELSI